MGSTELHIAAKDIHIGDGKLNDEDIQLQTISKAEGSCISTEETGERKDVSLWVTIRTYKQAVLWSVFFCLAALMWGYDMLLSITIVSIPSFRRDFGHIFEGEYIVSASWQIAFSTSSYVGSLFGAIAAGFLDSRFGKRISLAGFCILSVGAVLLMILTKTSSVLLVSKIMNGISLGAYLTIASSYTAEISPTQLRGLTTSLVQVFIVIGQLLSNLVIKALGTGTTTNAYRIPFAIQFVFPAILLLGIPFAPESPWHHVRCSNQPAALQTLIRLGHSNPTDTLAEMVKTVEFEESHAQSSYLDCFRGTDFRRTEISIGCVAVTNLVGVVFILGYSTYFFELAGISTSHAFSLSVGVTVLGFVSDCCSWLLVNSVGRRTSFMAGTAALTVLLVGVGILEVIPHRATSSGPVYGQVALIIAYAFVYFLTVGPMAWVVYAEIGSSRLRSKTCGLGIVCQNLFGILLNIVVPLMINPDKGNLKGKIGFIFAATSTLATIWIYFRVPETAHRTYDEMDVMFVENIPARKFKRHVIAAH